MQPEDIFAAITWEELAEAIKWPYDLDALQQEQPNLKPFIDQLGGPVLTPARQHIKDSQLMLCGLLLEVLKNRAGLPTSKTRWTLVEDNVLIKSDSNQVM